MNDTFVTLAFSATLAVGLAVLVRRRGWSMAIPLIAVGALVGWLPIGPSAPPDPEIILVAILAPLVFGEALGSSYLDLRKVSRPVLALAIGLVVATTVVIGAVGFLLVAMPIAMAMALGAVLAPDGRRRREHGRPAGRAAAATRVDPGGREPRQRRHRPHRAQGRPGRGGRGVGHAARGDRRLRRRGHGRRGRGCGRRLAADAGAPPQQRPGRRQFARARRALPALRRRRGDQRLGDPRRGGGRPGHRACPALRPGSHRTGAERHRVAAHHLRAAGHRVLPGRPGDPRGAAAPGCRWPVGRRTARARGDRGPHPHARGCSCFAMVGFAGRRGAA